MRSDTLRAVTLPRLSRARGVLLGGVGIYCLLFSRAYILQVSPLYYYIGMDFVPPRGFVAVLPWLLSIAPALCLPIALRRPSHLFLWVLYFAVYIPSQFVPLYARTASEAETVRFMLSLALCFGALCAGTVLPLLRLPRLSYPRNLFWPAIALVIALLGGYVFAVFHSHLRLVNLRYVYEQRALAGAIAQGAAINYSILWLAYALNPFLIAWGLDRRRPQAVWIGCLGQVFLYMTGGDKVFLLLLPVIPLLWYAAEKLPRHFGLVAASCGAAAIAAASAIASSQSAAGFLAFVFLVRALSLPGLLSAQYLEFFSAHPHTHFSHVRGIDALVRYPYEKTVALSVGEYFSGGPGPNANAHFWVGDGLAGLGLPGMFLVTPFALAILWLFDSAPSPSNRRIATLMCVYHAANLANASVFTALISGGLWLTAILAWLLPSGRELAPPVERARAPERIEDPAADPP